MANKSAAKVHIETYDEILGGAISGKGGALEIDLSKLHEFKGHPFNVVDDEKMNELVESIKSNGVMDGIDAIALEKYIKKIMDYENLISEDSN